MSIRKDGLLLLDKEQGITSHDAVSRLRKAGNMRKVGHAGTLDPMATGLLILCLGSATRLQDIFMGQKKTYEGEITFGWATDTQDAEGEPVGDPVLAEVSREAIEAELPRFIGAIEQVPPAYSAKKIDGQRAYKLAREGQTPDLPSRTVNVESFEIREVAPEGRATFEVICSSGTYVRTLAHDLGAVLGTGAHLSALRRTAIGSYVVEDALATAGLRERSEEEVFVAPHFLGMALDLPFGSVMIDRAQAEQVARGQEVVANSEGVSLTEGDRKGLIVPDGTLVAIAEVVRVIRDGGAVALQPRIVLV